MNVSSQSYKQQFIFINVQVLKQSLQYLIELSIYLFLNLYWTTKKVILLQLGVLLRSNITDRSL